ncbi:hypothetical protein A2313_04315 [Candidatus Roizmanbacteria bacterium RIFOXYB2_FULL_41_10]|uniref:Asparagine synthetase domain-containing protein n=1 Tax=Candidatus Roizmanbacteria bacterium RIFOXYA1_FULL_41_12 TaxID=1802082 RepID=A0A1F7KF86_9BACT|nr:MAG: hypothetical protein A2262_00300 [Candidatus Roizmanbacteria bacterium RIFOXYA2_FULL_41_8]OGK66522.1 MAG: hypothetical protein A2209_00785 [Candidatus Roizmanbacteria bacterium RIFOXYA1_FULL_41_12]OGK67061.1 MAG: hypothetical protein A2377_03635 [Candidatus Roizmanbacteria bacterium RIFOXYB1_FULL_41_27]OGK69384.1 MAG: hypothetical protein A2403_04145 [Candidatus Roizmanbacteria bacterium RIFOXYC1_FULL_41_16]OGK72157.1 MAG: hypothetical protein A2313_04315 [Candidatus Roizmanbacteria bac
MEKAWVNKYEQILADLFRNYQQQISNSKIGVLVSGGIDSSLIACLVNKHFPDSYLISLQSEKSVDDDFVAILSQFLKKNPFLVQVTRENLLAVQDEIKQLLNKVGVETNPMQMALASVYYWLFKAANKKDIKTIFTGQGPDILLGGYSKYRQLSGETLKQAIRTDLPLLKIDHIRDTAMAQKWGINVINPYLEQVNIDFCLSVPPQFINKNGQEKYLSRALGKKFNLPKKIVERPKKAMQYSTGVSKIIK